MRAIAYLAAAALAVALVLALRDRQVVAALAEGAGLLCVALFALRAAPPAPPRLAAATSTAPRRRALVVYYSLTGQCEAAVQRVADGLRAGGTEVTFLPITVDEPDYRYPFPGAAFWRITWASVLGRRVRLGPVALPATPVDVVVLVSQTWWMGISLPIATLLGRGDLRPVIAGKDVACLVICRGLWRRTLHQLTTAARDLGGRVVAGRALTHQGHEPSRFLSMWAYFLFPKAFAGRTPRHHLGGLLVEYGLGADAAPELESFGRALAGDGVPR